MIELKSLGTMTTAKRNEGEAAVGRVGAQDAEEAAAATASLGVAASVDTSEDALHGHRAA